MADRAPMPDAGVVRAFLRPFAVFYLLAGVEFAFAGWAMHAVLHAPGPRFPTVGVLLSAVGVVALVAGVRLHLAHRLRLRLLARGDEGTATVRHLVQTGTTRNNVPLFRIELSVQTGAHGRYDTTVKEYLTMHRVEAVSPGSRLAVRVDHENRDKLAIDWAAAR